MNWTIEDINDRDYVRITTRGLFNPADHLEMVEDIISKKFWKPGRCTLFDHRLLDFGNTTLDSIRETGSNHEINEQRIGDSKSAILMKSLADFARGRQFELLTTGKISARLRIFLSEDEALEWLLS
jgi:hypothetical protein